MVLLQPVGLVHLPDHQLTVHDAGYPTTREVGRELESLEEGTVFGSVVRAGADALRVALQFGLAGIELQNPDSAWTGVTSTSAVCENLHVGDVGLWR